MKTNAKKQYKNMDSKKGWFTASLDHSQQFTMIVHRRKFYRKEVQNFLNEIFSGDVFSNKDFAGEDLSGN
jgi:hypothetical protein